MSDICEWKFNCSKCGSTLRVDTISPDTNRVTLYPCAGCMAHERGVGMIEARDLMKLPH